MKNTINSAIKKTHKTITKIKKIRMQTTTVHQKFAHFVNTKVIIYPNATKRKDMTKTKKNTDEKHTKPETVNDKKADDLKKKLYTIQSVKQSKTSQPRITVEIQGQNFEALIDTGADKCYVNKKFINQLNLQIIKTKSKQIGLAKGSTEINNKTYFDIRIPDQQTTRPTKAYIVDDLHEKIILGTKYIKI
ncbi:hypothetical protein BDAP_000599 [Binucleata daphniae]